MVESVEDKAKHILRVLSRHLLSVYKDDRPTDVEIAISDVSQPMRGLPQRLVRAS